MTLEQIKALPAISEAIALIEWATHHDGRYAQNERSDWQERAKKLLPELHALQSLRDEAGEAYAAGWRQCARWAGRDDLVADIDSPAYEADKVAALHWPRPAPAAEAAQQGGVDAAKLKNALASLAWSSHPRGMEYTEQIMREVYSCIDTCAATPPSAPAVPQDVMRYLRDCLREAEQSPDGTAKLGAEALSILIRRLSDPVPQEGVAVVPACATITATSEGDAHRMAMALQEVGKEILGGFLVYESGGLSVGIESDIDLLDREGNFRLAACTREAFVSINGNLRLRRKAR